MAEPASPPVQQPGTEETVITAPATTPAAGPLDPDERHTAARLHQCNPQWLILWGCYSRLYWAFPLFDAPPGTLVSAPGTRQLLASMRQTERPARHPPTRP
jgi:hypothetical protein